MEATKWLKPSVKRVPKFGESARMQAVTRVNAEQSLEKDDAQAHPTALSGRLTRLGKMSEAGRPAAVPA